MTTKIDEAVAHAALALSYPNLRNKQVEVVGSFVSGNDVYGVLPTGYGKACVMGVSLLHSTIYLREIYLC